MPEMQMVAASAPPMALHQVPLCMEHVRYRWGLPRLHVSVERDGVFAVPFMVRTLGLVCGGVMPIAVGLSSRRDV